MAPDGARRRDNSPPTERRAGVLLHPTSLPGGPIGALDVAAFRFLDWLAAAGQTLWQVLPLNPTSGSPYSAFSSVAGNPLLIGNANGRDEAAASSDRVDFARAGRIKAEQLRAAFDAMQPDSARRRKFADFVEREEAWLSDYALFMALKDEQPPGAFTDWPAELVRRKPKALAKSRRRLVDAIALHQFGQFLFDEQWQWLRAYARDRGIRIVGDVSFYVAHDSADVWARPELFALDPDSRRPRLVGGVPPDYFSDNGQLWGVPVYDWDAMRADGFGWWIQRFHKLAELVDIIRIDHFRGFASTWQVPAGDSDAINGEWAPGPGNELFDAVFAACGELEVWAEDLGHITPEVQVLREDLGIPTTRVLQFAFGDAGAANGHLPFHYPRNTVVYTGTHDNDTTRGWWDALDGPHRDNVAKYFDALPAKGVPWRFIRMAYASVANTAMIPLQDILGLGSGDRMNVPGTMDGNWAWRFREGALTRGLAEKLLERTRAYGRV